MYLTIQGIVLRVTDYNDKDALLTMLTRRHGRLTVKARGLRRKNSPLIAPCQLLAYGEFTLFEYRGQYTINEAQSIELFTPLRRPDQAVSGYVFCPGFGGPFSGGYAEPGLQSLLLNCLYALSRLDLPESQVKAVFELRAACLSGYTPTSPAAMSAAARRRSGSTCRRVCWNAGIAAAPSRAASGCRFRPPCWRPCATSAIATAKKLFSFQAGGGYLTAAFRGDGGIPRHPAGTGLFHTGFLQIVTYIGENHVRIIRKISAKAGTRSGFCSCLPNIVPAARAAKEALPVAAAFFRTWRKWS